jgi:hypothetical protein
MASVATSLMLIARTRVLAGVSRRVLIATSLATLVAGTTFIGLTVHASVNGTHLNNPSNQKRNTNSIKSINGTKAHGLKLAPINLTTVAAENRINVSLMCPPTILSQDVPCVSVDRKTLNKVIAPEFPNWVPTWLRPKPKVVREIPNVELMQSAIVAGSVVEMFCTSILYPLKTVKSRVQAVEGRQRSMRRRYGLKRKKRLRILHCLKVLRLLFLRQVREGNLYAGMLPLLLVTVPCTGVYYGVRDITKRMLIMTLNTPGKVDNIIVSVIGALVADVITIIIRTPVDVRAVCLQVGTLESDDDIDLSTIAGNWFSDGLKRLPAAVLTDVPYLISRIALNGLIAQGNEGIGRYKLIYIATACVCALLTTPFDVARTRIFVDSNDDPTDGIDGGSGEGVLMTMKTVIQESDGGVRNLFRGWFERVTYG